MRNTARLDEARSIDDTVTHLELDIQLATEPIEGSLAIAGEAAIDFSGYMELINALEALRISEREGGTTQRKGRG